MKKSYAVETTFTIHGTFYVNAEDEDEARKLVKENCGIAATKAFSLLPLDEVGWDFPHLDTKVIGKVVQREQD